MPYDPRLVQPMRDELTTIGVDELTTADAVDGFMTNHTGTSMLVVNSVCGCAAGSARPGIALALKSKVRPDRIATVFAGQDVEATAKARSYFPDIPPSSPSVAIMKDGEIVHFIPRHMIEGQDPNGVRDQLIQAFDRYCGEPTKA